MGGLPLIQREGSAAVRYHRPVWLKVGSGSKFQFGSSRLDLAVEIVQDRVSAKSAACGERNELTHDRYLRSFLISQFVSCARSFVERASKCFV